MRLAPAPATAALLHRFFSRPFERFDACQLRFEVIELDQHFSEINEYVHFNKGLAIHAELICKTLRGFASPQNSSQFFVVLIQCLQAFFNAVLAVNRHSLTSEVFHVN